MPPKDFQISAGISEKTVLGLLKGFWDIDETNAGAIWKTHRCTNAAKLPDDFAAVCAFLADRKSVIEYLAPLENALVEQLQSLPDVKKLVESAQGKDDASLFMFKTRKALTAVLDAEEQQRYFNGGQAILQQQTQESEQERQLRDRQALRVKDTRLHTKASYATGKVTFDQSSQLPHNLTSYNPQNKTKVAELDTIALPGGVPKLTGLLTTSFNPILLKNGYHWKDPGAGTSHGEFTHRIQWYVLSKAWKTKVKAVNEPIEVFTAMGYLAAGGGNPDKDTRDKRNEALSKANGDRERDKARLTHHVTDVYLWEMLCDCFRSGSSEAKQGKPWSMTFNCPDVFNDYLRTDAKDQYPVLHVLMRGRYEKRMQGARLQSPPWLDKIMKGQRDYQFAVTGGTDTGSIAWRAPRTGKI